MEDTQASIEVLTKHYCDFCGSEMYKGHVLDIEDLQWICPECGLYYPVDPTF